MPIKPRHKSKPLTPEQLTLIYDAYTQPPTQPPTLRLSMATLARTYRVSVSVIHRAIHTEAARRAKPAA